MAKFPAAFEDSSGKIQRLTGELDYLPNPGATPGDVLTVQADGSVAAAPGGGSQPLTKTLTAAEIAGRWDGGASYAAIEWPEYDADTFALLVAETASTLDGDLTFSNIYAYDSGASTADVANNGTDIATCQDPTPGPYAVGYVAGNVVASASIQIIALVAGKSAYIVYVGGTTPPTTGTATIRALRLT